MAYKARRTALAAALGDAFGPEAELTGLHTGLHLLLHLKGAVPHDTVLAAEARAAGIRLAALSSYYLAGRDGCPGGTLVLGYGALPDDACAPLASALAAALKKACKDASDPSSQWQWPSAGS